MESDRNTLHNTYAKILQDAQQYTKDLKEYATEHASGDTPEDMETALKTRIKTMKSQMDQQLHDLEQSVLTRRPQRDDPDYEGQRSFYKQFLTEATSGLDRFRAVLESFFKKLSEAIERIVSWVVEKLANIIISIADLFETLIFPLLQQPFRRQ
jgi:hypothetical protein